MGEPSWLNKQKPTRVASAKQENRLAKTLGGKATANSGARFGENDVIMPAFEVEAKTTQASSFTLKMADIEKAENKCNIMKSVAFIVEFASHKREFVVLDIEDFKKLLPNP